MLISAGGGYKQYKKSFQTEEIRNNLTLFRPGYLLSSTTGVGRGWADSTPLRSSENIKAMTTTLVG